jgi:hypothetical protein
VREYQFQELRLAITNNERIKIKLTSWKSSGIQLWSSLKRIKISKFRNGSFHLVQTKRQSSGINFLEFRN